MIVSYEQYDILIECIVQYYMKHDVPTDHKIVTHSIYMVCIKGQFEIHYKHISKFGLYHDV